MIVTSCYKIDMHDDLVTMITKRGQTSVPSRLRRKAGLAEGKRLRWYAVSDSEFRVVVEPEGVAPGPLAALGFALRFQNGRAIRSDAAMKELREGEKV
jgi:bifunctional DNA-binding transcriptional regulator/antitoxin component of YhaV-PrlF toxin-antitoxin module